MNSNPYGFIWGIYIPRRLTEGKIRAGQQPLSIPSLPGLGRPAGSAGRPCFCSTERQATDQTFRQHP